MIYVHCVGVGEGVGSTGGVGGGATAGSWSHHLHHPLLAQSILVAPLQPFTSLYTVIARLTSVHIPNSLTDCSLYRVSLTKY